MVVPGACAGPLLYDGGVEDHKPETKSLGGIDVTVLPDGRKQFNVAHGHREIIALGTIVVGALFVYFLLLEKDGAGNRQIPGGQLSVVIFLASAAMFVLYVVQSMRKRTWIVGPGRLEYHRRFWFWQRNEHFSYGVLRYQESRGKGGAWIGLILSSGDSHRILFSGMVATPDLTRTLGRAIAEETGWEFEDTS